MLPQTPDNDTRQYLHPFDIIRQDHPTDKYMSLALCTKKHIQVTSFEYIPSINGLKFEIESNTGADPGEVKPVNFHPPNFKKFRLFSLYIPQNA